MTPQSGTRQSKEIVVLVSNESPSFDFKPQDGRDNVVFFRIFKLSDSTCTFVICTFNPPKHSGVICVCACVLFCSCVYRRRLLPIILAPSTLKGLRSLTSRMQRSWALSWPPRKARCRSRRHRASAVMHPQKVCLHIHLYELNLAGNRRLRILSAACGFFGSCRCSPVVICPLLHLCGCREVGGVGWGGGEG